MTPSSIHALRSLELKKCPLRYACVYSQRNGPGSEDKISYISSTKFKSMNEKMIPIYKHCQDKCQNISGNLRLRHSL